MQLRTLAMKQVDYREVAKQVYDFASSQSPLAPLIREALEVIEDAIDSFGCVRCYNRITARNSLLVRQTGSHCHKLQWWQRLYVRLSSCYSVLACRPSRDYLGARSGMSMQASRNMLDQLLTKFDTQVLFFFT